VQNNNYQQIAVKASIGKTAPNNSKTLKLIQEENIILTYIVVKQFKIIKVIRISNTFYEKNLLSMEMNREIAGLSKMCINDVSNFPDRYLLWNHFPTVLHVPES
jgi:hypothetical protein